MKVGIASPYFGTIGGGERYMFTIAKFFLDRGDQVDIFSSEKASANVVFNFFGLDLSRANFIPNIFFGRKGNFLGRLARTAMYDLIVFLSDGSVPTTLAKRNWLHFQTPFQYQNQLTPALKLKLSRFQKIICNSRFTKKYIDKTYAVDSVVIYPPVDVQKFSSRIKKENIILATGRFSDPQNQFQHAKKQELLIKTFQDLVKSGLPDWRLVITGSATDDSGGYVSKLWKLAKGYPIEIMTNPDFEKLRLLYSRAKIFWHAVGFGEDLKKNPARAEHFGITTVEAMAAGVVPVVFAGGGQKEIVEDGENGFLWETIQEFKSKTLQLIQDGKLRGQLALVAIKKSENFSIDKFYENLEKLLNK